MPATLTPLQKLKAALTGKTLLSQQLADSVALVATRDGELSASRSEITRLTAELGQVRGKLQGFESAAELHAAAVAKLEADRKSLDQLVSDGVAISQSNLGVPAAALPTAGAEPVMTDPADLHAHWATLEGVPKTEFYRKHEAILSKPAPKKK